MNYLLNKLSKLKWVSRWMPRLLVLLIPTVWLLIAVYFRLLISAEVLVSLLIITLIGSFASLKVYNGSITKRSAGQITLIVAVLFSAIIPLVFLLAQVNWRSLAGPSSGSGKKTPSFPALPKPVDLALVLADVRARLEGFSELPMSTEVTYPAVTDAQNTPKVNTDVSLVGLEGGWLFIRWPNGKSAFIINHRLFGAMEPSKRFMTGERVSISPEATTLTMYAQYGRPYPAQSTQVETHFPLGYEGLRTFKQAGMGRDDTLWGKLPPRTLNWTCSMCLRNADGTLLTGKLPPVWTLDRLPGPGKLTKKSYPWPASGILHLRSIDVPVGQDFLVLSTDGPWKMFVTLKIKKGP